MRVRSWMPSAATGASTIHEMTARYVNAVSGCAQFLDTPPQITEPDNDDARAWQALGEIIFWMLRPGMSESDLEGRCRDQWAKLHSNLAFQAVDPLMCLLQSDLVRDSTDPIGRFATRWRQQVRRIVEFGLRNHTRLTTLFVRQRAWRASAVLPFLLNVLAEVGTPEGASIAEKFIDSPEVGAIAAAAVRKLRGIPDAGSSS